MAKVRLGMIGCGFGALDLCAPFFRYLENAALLPLVDQRPGRLVEPLLIAGG